MVDVEYCCVVSIILWSYFTEVARSAPQRNIDDAKRINNSTITRMYLNNAILNETFSNLNINFNNSENSLRSRVKRQASAGAGKFADAAKMPQIKTFRLFLQLFKNLWADSYIGGSGPFHPDVVKPVLYLFKDKIIAFFFPDPREEHKKKSH